MICSEYLTSFHVLEKTNSGNLLIWTYPTILPEIKQFILTKKLIYNFICLKKKSFWIYIKAIESNAIILVTNEFEPNKYKLVCDILGEQYRKTRNPIDLTRLYLNLFISGKCTLQQNGSLLSCNLKKFQSISGIKTLLNSFELESTLIYSAILLKRRIIAFHSNIESLQPTLLVISKLVPNRNFSDNLHPFIESSKELKGFPFFLAGTTNRSLIDENLYDLFINLETHELKISPLAKDSMNMTKIHREMATFFVKLSQSDLSDTAIIEKIYEKTQELLEQLKSLASVTTANNVKMLTINDLKTKNLNDNMENFLFNLAIAENVMIL